MSTNHAPGPVSSSVARSHGRRNSAAETRVRAGARVAPGAAAPAAVAIRRLPLDLRPLLLPRRVVGAVLLAVAAIARRGLPEPDRVEVRRGRVGVVLRARALLDLVHERARL